MAEEYDIQAIINDLKETPEMDPDQHDGCYELMRETIEAYSKLEDFSVIDYRDLNLVYLTTVGTWKQGVEGKKKNVVESHLRPEDKEYLTMLWDDVWDKASRGEYTNNELSAKDGCSIGLFGTGFFSFMGKTTNEHAQQFIRMCVDILSMSDDYEIYDRAEKVLTVSFKGMKAASASMILHCLKPRTFPILNANTGFKNIFEVLGVNLTKLGNIETYIKNCRIINAFRDQNFKCKNYRIYDIAAQNIEKYRIKNRYGKYASWEIVNDDIARKTCDKSFFDYHGSALPNDILWFFNAEKLQPGGRQEVVLYYGGLQFDAYVQRESSSSAQTRVFWNTALAKRFDDFANDGIQHIIEFRRMGDNIYDVEFVKGEEHVWLITWNRNNWPWHGYESYCESTRAGHSFTDSWACVSSKPQIGDEVFLLKLGEDPRGIIGHGRVVREQYEKEHYNPEKAAEGKKHKAIDVEFDRLLNYEYERFISQAELADKCSGQYWSPQGSGIEIKQEVVPTLRALWASVTAKRGTFDLIKTVSFLNQYSGKHYRVPEKAGDQADYMSEMKKLGQEARQTFIDFIKTAIKDIPGLEYVSCSNWVNQGQVVEKYLWIELKKKEWQSYPNSVSVSIERSAINQRICFSIRSDTKNVSSKEVDYEKQFRLLDCELHSFSKYSLHIDLNTVKKLCNEGDIHKLEIVEEIYGITEKDCAGTILDETTKAIKQIYPLYEHVMNGGEVSKEDNWWPNLEEYDPGITAEQYETILRKGYTSYVEMLSTIYYLYKMGGSGTCVEIAEEYGGSPYKYVGHVNSVAKYVASESNCPLHKREEKDANRLWPVLFFGKEQDPGKPGTFAYKLREPLSAAIKSMEADGFFDELIGNKHKMKNSFDHNMILYGPPGTGKTYNSVYHAVAICEDKPVGEVRKENYTAVMARYNALRRAGRILFTTFHQSYGYEEFIEGIRPVMVNDENNGDLEYEIRDGIFKTICNAARTPEGIEIDHNASIWFVRLKDGGDNDLKRECFSNGEIRFEGPEDPDEGFVWEYERLSKMQPGDFILSYGGKSVLVDGIGVVEDDDLTYDDSKTSYKWTIKVKWLLKDVSIDVKEINGNHYLPNFNLAAMSHMKVSDLLQLVESNGGMGFKENVKPYVLIIDEINRGNISKIFGELITLIEDTKRAGAEEAMEAVLPYSGESFSVPNNVYILGTMNTADRSIALMDTALRRRFKFVEMMPNSEVLESLGAGTILIGDEKLNVAKMLDVINERIEYLFDREHTIGHAFFTKLADDPSIDTLADIFEKNVIPLLQEYFYEDYEKIQLVLGDNDKEDEYKFILDKKVELKQIFKGNPDIDLPSKGYHIQKSAFRKLQSYKQIGKEL